MDGLNRFLKDNATGDVVPQQALLAAADSFGCGHAAVEAAALALGLLPARYQRNRNSISIPQQARLAGARVAVIGCGGLGGHVLEQLARLGVGTLVAVDPDVFEAHNLNRQLLATMDSLGRPKVEVAVERLASVNPAVTVTPVAQALTADNATTLLAGADIAVDALDSIPARRALGAACAALSIPLVHGAIGGWFAQITSVMPGKDTLSRLFPDGTAEKGTEQYYGNPAFTPAICASLEVAEVCKILLNQGQPLAGRLLLVNLLDMSFDVIAL